jgi:hypothetical protein
VRPIPIVLSLLAGILAGWYLVPGGAGSPEEPGTPGPEAVSAPAPADSLPAPEPEGPPPASGESPAAALTAPVAPPADLAALLARFPVREYPSGTCAITGTVLRHGDGAPLAGIAIDAIIHGTTPGVEPVGIEHPELLPFILEEIDQYHYDAAMARRAVTDEEGRFRIEGLLPEEEYHLTPARSDEWYVYTFAQRSQLSPGADVEFRAAAVAFVDVEVVDGAGSPIAMGSVEMRDPQEENGARFNETFTPRDREVRVPIPFTRFAARLDDGRRSEPVDLSLAPGGRGSARLVVREPSGFDIAVLAADPIDLVGTEVIAVADDGEALPEDLGQVRYGNGAEEAEIDPDTGAAELDLEPGRYHVVLVRDGEEVASRRVALGEGRVAMEFSAPPRDRSHVSIVSVLDPQGAPADSVSFHARARMRMPSGDEHDADVWIRSRPLGDGRSALISSELMNVPREDGWTLVGHTLICHSERYGTAVGPVSFGTSSVQEYRFVEPAELIVDLLGYVGSDLQQRLRLQVAGVEGGRRGMDEIEGELDPLGRVTFPPLAPGAWRLHGAVNGRWGGAVIERELTLRPGENSLAIELPELHALAVRFPDGKRASHLPLRDTAGDWISNAEVGEDGIAEYSDLLPGSYRLGDEMGSMTVTVPAGGVVEFRPVTANAFAVSISDEDGWLARAGFCEGDRIIGLDGELYAGVRTLQFALMRAFTAGEGELIVEREGSEVRLVIPKDDPANFLELGGELEPAVRGGDR